MLNLFARKTTADVLEKFSAIVTDLRTVHEQNCEEFDRQAAIVTEARKAQAVAQREIDNAVTLMQRWEALVNPNVGTDSTVTNIKRA